MQNLRSYKFTNRPLLWIAAFALLLSLTGLIFGERSATVSIILASPPNAADSSQHNPDKTPVTNADLISVIGQTPAGCPAPSFAANASLPSQAPWAVVVADFNNDDKADIASANFGFNNLTVALGDGAGGFGPSQTFPSAVGAISIASGDFNGDGKLDLAVADWFEHQVAVSLGAGDGSFGSPTRINVGSGSGPRQVATGDFNRDGKLDFATVNFFSNNISVILGDGSGGFSQASGSPVAVSGSPRSLRVANLNGDDNPDIAVASESGSLWVLLGNGLGGFVPASGTPISIFQTPYYVGSGDFNGDSKTDLVTGNYNSSDVSILFGNGAGAFQLMATVSVGSRPGALLVIDLTADGKPEIVSVNLEASTLTILLNDGTGTLSSSGSIPVGDTPRGVGGGDLNSDGITDLAVANAGSYTISILLGRGAGAFGGPEILPVAYKPAMAVAVGDYNGDSRLDLAAGNAAGVSILLGNSAGSFTAAGNFGFGPGVSVVTPDVNGDGKLDLLKTDGSFGNSLQVMLGIGDGSFGPRTTFALPSGGTSIALGDFNNDGKIDLATGHPNIAILLGNGSGGFSVGSSVSIPQSSFVTSGDFNNDGKTDLVALRIFQNDLLVVLGNGNGSFSAPGAPIPLGSSVKAIAINDFNGDGNADFAVATQVSFNQIINAVAILLGNGNGGFSAPTSHSVGTTPSSIAVADFNSDGTADLATANRDSNNLSVLLGDGSGLFGSPTSFSPGLHPVFVAAGDVNGDGRKDLLAAIDDGVTVLANTCSASPVIPPSLSISDVSLTEGDSGTTNVVFDVTLSGPSNKTVSVGFNTFGMTATSGVDFQPAAGRLFFPPGSTTQTVTVPILADLMDEFDETVGLNLKEELNATISRTSGIATILDDDLPPSSSIADVSVQEGNSETTSANLSVTLSAISGKPISIQYATSDTAGLNNCNVVNGVASSRCDYATSVGTLRLAAGETSKPISIPIVDDAYAEGNESFTVTLSNPTEVMLGTPASATVTINDNETVNGTNPIDGTAFFVRQQYVDFLGREPDPGGFAAWQAVINNCPPNDTTCDRIHVSSGFFRSPEFQERGYFVYRFYPVAFGRKPGFDEFIPDLAKVSGFLSDAELEAARVAFVAEFMNRPAFVTKFNGLNNTQYVDTLLATAQITHPNRNAWIAALDAGTKTRAQVLREIAESTEVFNKYFNQAFVVMQYFGYLRREPDAFYLDWIAHLDSTNDFRSMINGFMNSLEYRFRFGP